MIQFGGASANGYISGKQRADATAALSREGKFDKGIYTYTDDKGQKHNQDAFEAVWERGLGRKVVYPKPRYDDHVTMNPETYSWVPDASAPGVAYKWLASFTERNARTGFIQVDAGATLSVAPLNAPQILFLTKGAVTCDGNAYPAHTIFGVETNEKAKPIKASERSEFFCVQLPQF